MNIEGKNLHRYLSDEGQPFLDGKDLHRYLSDEGQTFLDGKIYIATCLTKKRLPFPYLSHPQPHTNDLSPTPSYSPQAHHQ